MDRSETCTWTLDDAENCIWRSSCGAVWSFMDDGPEENGCNYCHKCGGALEIVRPAPETNDNGWKKV